MQSFQDALPDLTRPPEEVGPSVYIETYGCQMNTYDSQAISGLLRGEGFRLVDNELAADAILLNTCSVRELAEHKVISRDRDAIGPGRRSQVEGPDQPVGAGFPVGGDPRHRRSVGSLGGQAHDQITDDRELVDQVGLLGIERLGFAVVAVLQADLASGTGRSLRRALARGEGKRGGEDHGQQSGQGRIRRCNQARGLRFSAT